MTIFFKPTKTEVATVGEAVGKRKIGPFTIVQLLWKTVWFFLKNLKIELPSDVAIPLLGIHPK